MPGTGTTTIDFGAFAAPSPNSPLGHPKTEATVQVTGQTGIIAGSLVEAWIRAEPAGSADHSMDEHMIESLQITARNIAAGTGFDIHARCTLGGTYGTFTVNWAWA